MNNKLAHGMEFEELKTILGHQLTMLRNPKNASKESKTKSRKPLKVKKKSNANDKSKKNANSSLSQKDQRSCSPSSQGTDTSVNLSKSAPVSPAITTLRARNNRSCETYQESSATCETVTVNQSLQKDFSNSNTIMPKSPQKSVSDTSATVIPSLQSSSHKSTNTQKDSRAFNLTLHTIPETPEINQSLYFQNDQIDQTQRTLSPTFPAINGQSSTSRQDTPRNPQESSKISAIITTSRQSRSQSTTKSQDNSVLYRRSHAITENLTNKKSVDSQHSQQTLSKNQLQITDNATIATNNLSRHRSHSSSSRRSKNHRRSSTSKHTLHASPETSQPNKRRRHTVVIRKTRIEAHNTVSDDVRAAAVQ